MRWFWKNVSIEVQPMFVAIEHEERKRLCDSVSRDDEVAGVVVGGVGRFGLGATECDNFCVGEIAWWLR